MLNFHASVLSHEVDQMSRTLTDSDFSSVHLTETGNCLNCFLSCNSAITGKKNPLLMYLVFLYCWDYSLPPLIT